MKKLHIAIGVSSIEASVEDYIRRLEKRLMWSFLGNMRFGARRL